jgi:hypothetical protein
MVVYLWFLGGALSDFLVVDRLPSCELSGFLEGEKGG